MHESTWCLRFALTVESCWVFVMVSWFRTGNLNLGNPPELWDFMGSRNPLPNRTEPMSHNVMYWRYIMIYIWYHLIYIWYTLFRLDVISPVSTFSYRSRIAPFPDRIPAVALSILLGASMKWGSNWYNWSVVHCFQSVMLSCVALAGYCTRKSMSDLQTLKPASPRVWSQTRRGCVFGRCAGFSQLWGRWTNWSMWFILIYAWKLGNDIYENIWNKEFKCTNER